MKSLNVSFFLSGGNVQCNPYLVTIKHSSIIINFEPLLSHIRVRLAAIVLCLVAFLAFLVIVAIVVAVAVGFRLDVARP